MAKWRAKTWTSISIAWFHIPNGFPIVYDCRSFILRAYVAYTNSKASSTSISRICDLTEKGALYDHSYVARNNEDSLLLLASCRWNLRSETRQRKCRINFNMNNKRHHDDVTFCQQNSSYLWSAVLDAIEIGRDRARSRLYCLGQLGIYSGRGHS